MNDYIELRSVVATVLRRWWVVALFALLFGALGYVISSRQTPVYQATTSLLVGRSIQSADVSRFDLQTSQQLAETYADLARRQPVLQRTIDELGLDTSWGQLRSRVRAGVSGNTQLLEIRVEADSPEEAVVIADEVARQLILLSPTGAETEQQQEAQAFANQRVVELRQKIEDGQQQLEGMEAELLAASPTKDVSQLNDRITALEALISRWESSYLELLSLSDASGKANNLAVLEPAQASSKPVRPKPKLSIIIATLVGAVLGTGLILLLDFLDDSIKTSAEMERSLGVSALGAVDRINGKDPRDLLIINHDPFSPAYENYRLLRTKIQFMSVDHPGRTVMVTSPGRSEGKSLTAANLGIVMAQAGLKTVIIDANLRQPVMHDLFQLSNQEGLTHLLRGHEQVLERYLRSTLVPNLRVLPSGATPSNPAELLGSKRMGEVLRELSESVDVVLCDVPEAVTVADASVLSNQVDGVLLVIDAGHTDRNAAMQAVANLRDAGANLLGGIFNRIGAKRGRTVFTRSADKSEASVSSQPAGSALDYVDSPGD